MNFSIFFVLFISNVTAFNLPQGLNELDEYVKRTNFGRKLFCSLQCRLNHTLISVDALVKRQGGRFIEEAYTVQKNSPYYF